MAPASPLLFALIAAKGALQTTQNEVGWLYSNTRDISGYPGNPDATKTVTQRLNHLSAGLTCIYVFAVIEEYIDPRSAMWTDFLALLKPDDLEKLKAFKHVRNTIAHGFDGNRASRNRADFDAVMSRSTPAARIQGVASHDSDTITLSHTAGWECFSFAVNMIDWAIGQEANRR